VIFGYYITFGRQKALIMADLLSIIGMICYLLATLEEFPTIFIAGRVLCGVCCGAN